MRGHYIDSESMTMLDMLFVVYVSFAVLFVVYRSELEEEVRAWLVIGIATATKTETWIFSATTRLNSYS